VLHRSLAELLALIVPPACAVCREPLSHSRDVVCLSCRVGLPWLHGPRCRRCGLPAPCRPCPAASASFEQAWAPVAYGASARSIVMAFKFGGGVALAGFMAAQIAAGMEPQMSSGATLVAVPLHPKRRRQRGFDQAQRLTEALGVLTGMPVSRCLRRSGVASRQLGAGRSERTTAGRILLKTVGRVPEVVVLVDDVHTTGATFEACAQTLRAAGAQRVVCLAYARTLSGGGVTEPTPWLVRHRDGETTADKRLTSA